MVFSYNFSLADEPPSCSIPNTSDSILECVLSKHPNLIRESASIKQGEEMERQAAQRPNPELSVKSVYGKNLGEKMSSTEFSLAHTVEFGGKRSARIEKASAEKQLIDSQMLRTKEDVYTSTLRTLHRIRQVHSEIKTLEEALSTFRKIQQQYKSRPRLSPEQEASLNVFQLAEGDYKLRKNALEMEENALETNIEVSMGIDFPHNDSILPTRIKNWPILLEKMKPEIAGSDIQLAKSQLTSAQAELSLSQGDSWPDLKIGPTFESQTEGKTHYWNYGVNLTFPLPLFHINGGGRAVAAAGLMRAEKNLHLRRKELSKTRQTLITQYQMAASTLMDSLSISEIDKKHTAVEKQFERGVVSSSLVIEVHRQMVDFTKTQNEQELIALETLWKLKILDGTLFEGNL